MKRVDAFLTVLIYNFVWIGVMPTVREGTRRRRAGDKMFVLPMPYIHRKIKVRQICCVINLIMFHTHDYYKASTISKH